MSRCALPVLLLLAAPAWADPAAVEAGRRIYEENCRDCHGPTAREGRAGDIRGLDHQAVAFAIRGFEEMPEFDLIHDEVAAIVAYLAALKAR